AIAKQRERHQHHGHRDGLKRKSLGGPLIGGISRETRSRRFPVLIHFRPPCRRGARVHAPAHIVQGIVRPALLLSRARRWLHFRRGRRQRKHGRRFRFRRSAGCRRQSCPRLLRYPKHWWRDRFLVSRRFRRRRHWFIPGGRGRRWLFKSWCKRDRLFQRRRGGSRATERSRCYGNRLDWRWLWA